MSASIIAIGNPGAGKSTILNSLAGELLFKSGVSIGSGLTEVLDERENNRGRFYDTPGLSDDDLREQAAKAISTALRKGGDFKILFFVRLEAGRIVREDKATFKLVLESAPEIGNKYGIVTNKLPLNVAKLLQDPDKAAQLLTKLFARIPEENRCASSSITYLTYRDDADSVDNYLLDVKSLKTLEGSYFADFVYGQVETVHLTEGKANDIEIEDYDKIAKLIEVLEKRMDSDRQMFMEEKRRMLEQQEKAEKDKEQFFAREKERFDQQLEFLAMQMKQKEREMQTKQKEREMQMKQKEREAEVSRNVVEKERFDQQLKFLAMQTKQKEREMQTKQKERKAEVSRNDVERLRQEQEKQEFQKAQLELAAYRERNRVKLRKKNEKCKVM